MRFVGCCVGLGDFSVWGGVWTLPPSTMARAARATVWAKRGCTWRLRDRRGCGRRLTLTEAQQRYLFNLKVHRLERDLAELTDKLIEIHYNNFDKQDKQIVNDLDIKPSRVASCRYKRGLPVKGKYQRSSEDIEKP